MEIQKIISLLNKPLHKILTLACKANNKIYVPVIGRISQAKFCHNNFDDNSDSIKIFKKNFKGPTYDNDLEDDFEDDFKESFSQRNYREAENFRGNYRHGDNSRRNSFDEGRNYNSHQSNFEHQRNDYRNNSQSNKPDWSSSTLQPFEKNFYIPSERMQALTEDEINQYRKSHNMMLTGNDIPAPIEHFSDYDFPDSISKIFTDKQFKSPTAIQSQGWSIGLSGRDLVGIGQTGSGKTLGFVLPAIIHIKNQPKLEHGEGPIALIMAPTRELVQQINEVAQTACRGMNSGSVSVFGGADKGRQSQMLRSGPSICVATPGRLNDFLQMGVTNLKRCTYLVLDEADRMLDMGFEPQIRQIINHIRPDRQTTMWSATWATEVQDLASDYLNDHIKLTVGSDELSANPDVSQQIEICDSNKKIDILKEILSNELGAESAKVLIFCETKRAVDTVSRILQNERMKAAGIHGDYSQNQRDRALSDFRRGRSNILVATNVAARGLDVDDITTVINFDFPTDIEDYVHRIGRTGRAGKSGKSISFVTEESGNMVQKLISILKKSDQPIPEGLYDLQSSSGYNNKNRKSNYRFGRNNSGRNNSGRNNSGRNDYGRNDYGRNDYGRNNSGRNNY